MDLDQVRAFTHVAQAGSFTRAAQQLNMPKSTVSRWVSDLEERLGVRLLHRTTRKLSLTDAGRLYFQRTYEVIRALEAADREVTELESEPRGTLRVTAPTDLCNSFLVPLLPKLHERYPELQVVLLVTNWRVDLVAQGIDLAIRAGALSDSGLVARRLDLGRSALYASRDYLNRAGEPDSLEALAAHRCLVFSSHDLHARWQLSKGEVVRDVDVTGRFAASDYGTLASLCAAGEGIALLPAPSAHHFVASGTLQRVLSDWNGAESMIHAVYPSPAHLTAKVRVFIDMLLERASSCAGRPRV